MVFADRLKSLLNKKGLKAVDLARSTGLSEAAISDYLNGKKEPRGRQSIAIAHALNVSLDVLWDNGCTKIEQPYREQMDLKIDGLTGFQAILADIYGSCEMESVMGEYAECLYFSLGSGKNRYALEENDFDRLYNTAKQNIQQMTNLLIKDEKIVRHMCQKDADTPSSVPKEDTNPEINMSFEDTGKPTTEELEAEYKKSRSKSAKSTGLSASSITSEDTKTRTDSISDFLTG